MANRRSGKKGKRSIPLHMIIGLFFLSLGLYGIYESVAFNHVAGRAEGTVVAFKKRQNGTHVTYRPIVKWRAPNRQIHSFENSFGTSPPAYDIGESIEVLYAPDDYTDARIGGYASWLGTTISIIFGVVFIFLPFFMKLSIRHKT